MNKTSKLITSNKLLPALLLSILMILAACAPAMSINVTSTAAAQVNREAKVRSVEILVTDTDRADINAVVRGDLTESCATLGESQVEYASNTFRITVYALSPADRGCAQVTTAFETTIPLNTKDLPAGSYNVIANGASAVFQLPVENATPDPTPTVASTPISTATLAFAPCTDSAKFVTDVTTPDNTVIASNTPFTKTWRLKNTGSCTWDSSYLVVYISGTTMSQQPGYWIVPRGQTVAPGETVDISVGMTSPVENGSYQSSWGLKKENGTLMPIQGGANGNSFYVKIKVDNGMASGTITDASIAIELEQGSGSICTVNSTYFVHAHITTDGPTTATYEVNSTAGQIAAGNFQNFVTSELSPVVTGTLVFDRAETKTLNWRFVGPYPYPDNINVNLRVNGREWYSSKLSCEE